MKWYEDEVKRVERERDSCGYIPQTIFYGSSTIRLWDTLYDDFKKYQPLNLGFGGSTLAACVWFYNRIFASIQKPERIIIYAGDNDLGDGRLPEEVFIFYQQLVYKIQKQFGSVACAYISIKPSPNRWNILPHIKETNSLIKEDIEAANNGFLFIDVFGKMIDHNSFPRRELFDYDGLHMNGKGYFLWKQVLLNHTLFHQ